MLRGVGWLGMVYLEGCEMLGDGEDLWWGERWGDG